ncbi:MAG TPA: DUF167 domain-containing protein [Ktedonobacteraceae bacterium]
MRITVRVVPRSSKNEIRREGEIFKVRLTASPVQGAANEALLKLLAERLNLPRRNLQIIQGTTGRQKIIQIDDTAHLTLTDIQQKLV